MEDSPEAQEATEQEQSPEDTLRELILKEGTLNDHLYEVSHVVGDTANEARRAKRIQEALSEEDRDRLGMSLVLDMPEQEIIMGALAVMSKFAPNFAIEYMMPLFQKLREAAEQVDDLDEEEAQTRLQEAIVAAAEKNREEALEQATNRIADALGVDVNEIQRFDLTETDKTEPGEGVSLN